MVISFFLPNFKVLFSKERLFLVTLPNFNNGSNKFLQKSIKFEQRREKAFNKVDK